MTFFIQSIYNTDKWNKNIMIQYKSQPSANNRSTAVKSRTVRKEPARQSGTRGHSHENPLLPQTSPYPADVDSRHA